MSKYNTVTITIETVESCDNIEHFGKNARPTILINDEYETEERYFDGIPLAEGLTYDIVTSGLNAKGNRCFIHKYTREVL